MTNNISNIKDVGSVIAKMGAGIFKDKCQYIKGITKETGLEGQVNGFNKGSTININVPAVFPTGTGASIATSVQGVNERTVPLTLDTQRHVAVELTSQEIHDTLSLQSWAKRILVPAVNNLVQETEADILTRSMAQTGNTVGTAGASAFDTDMILESGEILDSLAAPMDDDRKLLLYPKANRLAVSARKGLFQSSEEISKQYKKGYIGTADGYDFLRNNLLPSHTNGSDVTGGLVAGAVASGAATIAIDGLSGGATITKGSTFTIAGVFAVHPITKVKQEFLHQFVVAEDATANGSGAVTLPIGQAIFDGTSVHQNIDVLPADNAAVTFVGDADTTYRQGLAFCPSAARVAFAPLVKPDGVDMVGQESTDDGYSIRVIRDYDVTEDKLVMRLDILYGFTVVRPEWQVKLIG